MKFLAKVKVLHLEPDRYAEYKGKQVVHTDVVFECDDTFFAASIWGEERVQVCKEAQISGKELYCVYSISGKQFEKRDGSTGYINYVNLKSIL